MFLLISDGIIRLLSIFLWFLKLIGPVKTDRNDAPTLVNDAALVDIVL